MENSSDPLIAALDALTIAGAAIWPAVYSWGPTDDALPWRVLLGVIVAAAIVRHVIQPRPSVIALLPGALRSLWSAEGTRWTVTAFAASRAAVLATGLLAVVYWGTPPGSAEPETVVAWDMQRRWDTLWYLSIARRGYQLNPALDEQQNLAFFPAFPMLMRLAGDLVTIPAYVLHEPELLGTTGDTRVLLGGVLVNLAALLAALLLLYRLARLDLTSERSRWAILVLCAHPFGVFFSAAYTESVFLLASVGAFLAFRRARFLEATGWGVLLGLTRPNGFMISAALAVLALERWRATHPRARLWSAAAVLGPVAGLAIHMSYLWWRFGDPLVWSKVQQAWGRSTSLTIFFTGRWDRIQENGWEAYVYDFPYEIANTAMLCLALAMAWWARRLSWSYAALIVVALLPAIIIDTPSLGRMTAPLFPVALALAIAVPAGWRPVTAGASMALQLFGAALFYTWRPLF